MTITRDDVVFNINEGDYIDVSILKQFIKEHSRAIGDIAGELVYADNSDPANPVWRSVISKVQEIQREQNKHTLIAQYSEEHHEIGPYTYSYYREANGEYTCYISNFIDSGFDISQTILDKIEKEMAEIQKREKKDNRIRIEKRLDMREIDKEQAELDK